MSCTADTTIANEEDITRVGLWIYTTIIVIGSILAAILLAYILPPKSVPVNLIYLKGALFGWIILGLFLTTIGVWYQKWWFLAPGTGILSFSIGLVVLAGLNSRR